MTESPKVADCNGCDTCQPSQAAILKLCRYTREVITQPVAQCAICESCNLYPCTSAALRIDEQVDQLDWVEEEHICPNCDYSLKRCQEWKEKGGIACCPECDHGGRS